MKKYLLFLLVLSLMVSLAACGTGAGDLPEGALSAGTNTLAAPNASGGIPFTDVPAGADCVGAVTWCWENKIMNGTSDTAFSPEDTLTRAMLATVLYRAEGEPAVSAGPDFRDVQAGMWYSNAVVWAAMHKQVATDHGYTAIAAVDNMDEEDEIVVNQINVTFNGHTYTATLAENPTAQAFVQLIQERGGSLTVSAGDYGGFEKVAPLGTSLPADNQQTTTSAGDFVLYSGNQIVLFYGSNSWSYTRLGKLDGDLSSLRSDLGGGNVEITYSLVK